MQTLLTAISEFHRAFKRQNQLKPRIRFRRKWCLHILLLAFWLPFEVSIRASSGTLLGWNNLGMHCMDSSYAEFSILPPYNTIETQLIIGGKLITNGSGYTVTYQAVADPDGSINTTSINKGDWGWFESIVYGAPQNFTADMGLAGWNMPGPLNIPQSMLFENINHPAPGVSTPVNWFRAEGIPLTPYDDAGVKNPYPMMRLIARNPLNQPVATNDIVLPVSDEMDCRACHAANSQLAARPAGGWVTDLNPIREYRLNILKIHDDREFANHPALYQEALIAKGYDTNGLFVTTMGGKPMLCAACHASEALGAPSFASSQGNGTVPSLTASVHTRHAPVQDPVFKTTLDNLDNRSACYRCHPGSTTRCLRGAMGNAVAADGSMEMQCQSCHGNMSKVGSAARVGWFMEPKCQSCHSGTATSNSGQIRYNSVFDASGNERVPSNTTFATSSNTPAAGLSLYRFSVGHGGLQCSACHGSTHAEFPSAHRNDNIRNVQLQGHAGVMVECISCHATVPSTANGGPHGMHPVGQSWVSSHHDVINQVGIASCKSCHGADLRGTVLSRVQGNRSLNAGNFGTLALYRGATIGCYTCHQGPSNENRNTNAAPGIANVTGQTMAGNPVDLVLPGNVTGVTLRIISQAQNGSVGLSNGIATYFPFDGFTGTDTFTFAGYDGSKNSQLATGTVFVLPAQNLQPPTINLGPVSQNANPGNPVSLSVNAAGSPALNYQWYKNGWPIAAATNATFTLAAAAATDAGSYVVLVSNPVGAVASAPAQLAVVTPLVISTQPVSQTVRSGATVVFSVRATGAGPFSYQWSQNGTPIATATASNLTLTGVTLMSAGNYQVRVSNALGYVNSAVAILTVQEPPAITLQPASQTVNAGTSAVFTVTATGSNPLAYQWIKNQLAIAGATQSSVVLSPASLGDSGNYSVWVTNAYGSATSALATLTVLDPPIITLQPASQTVGAGTAVTFSVTATGGNPLSYQWFKDQGAISGATLPDLTLPSATPGDAGNYSVLVTNIYGSATSAVAALTVIVPPPAITGLNPVTGGVGMLVSLVGTNLTWVTSVTFNGTNAAFTKVSDAQINATVPAGATTGMIAVTSPGGSAASPIPYTILPTPAITGFTPAQGPVGTRVTVNGSNFLGTVGVSFNGTAATTATLVSATRITAVVPAGAASGPISVTTSGGTSTSSANFTVLPPPAIVSLNPTIGPAGTIVTITGTNLTGATSVTFNNVSAAFSVVSNTEITATVPATATTGKIVIITPGGKATSAVSFTLAPPPTLAGFSPDLGPVGTKITILGSGFVGTVGVSFNGTPAITVTKVSATQLTATLPAGATTGPISVITAGGLATSTSNFTVPPPPAIATLSPASGAVGMVISITGSNLTGAISVAFNNVSVGFSVVSDTEITTSVPAGATTGRIVILTPGGKATSPGNFTVVPVPVIAGFTPDSAPEGTKITINGSGFVGTFTVAFNGLKATSATRVSTNQLTATVPVGASSGPLTVTTAGGTAVSAGNFTVIPKPVITSFSPASGVVGASITLNGSNFTGASEVKFSGTNAVFSLLSPGTISCVVPAGAKSGRINVVTPGGVAVSPLNFTVLAKPLVAAVKVNLPAENLSLTTPGASQ